mgnify:CR=1 FL=1
MARQKSEFVSAFGTSFEIFKRLADEVLAQGGGDDDLRRVLNDDIVVRDMVSVLRGSVVVQAIEHLVNCDVHPHIPSGWSLDGKGTEHRKGGIVKLERRGEDLYANGRKIELFLAEGQKGIIEGYVLRKVLANEPVLNANVLDYLLEHPELIPESWKGKYVFFWGDVYRVSDGLLCVRYLCWLGGGWRWRCLWFDDDFSGGSPAVVSASQSILKH